MAEVPGDTFLGLEFRSPASQYSEDDLKLKPKIICLNLPWV